MMYNDKTFEQVLANKQYQEGLAQRDEEKALQGFYICYPPMSPNNLENRLFIQKMKGENDAI